MLEDTSGLQLLDVESDGSQAASRMSTLSKFRVLPPVLLLASIATVLLIPPSRWLLRSAGRFEDKYEFPSQCGLIDNNTDYTVAEAWGYSYDHIPNPEMCCAMCQADPKCKAFTWVADAGLDGCPSQCWIKGGLPYQKTQKKGVVSGLPPPRETAPPIGVPIQLMPLVKKQHVGTVYCLALITPYGYEKDIIRYQYEHNFGIFACDEHAVYSNTTFEVAPGLTTSAIVSDMHANYGGDSGTALNAWIFIALWKKVLDDGNYAKHAWTVKVDADTVFFPHRLPNVLKDFRDADYINNCQFGLHGPFEIFSKKAMDALKADYGNSWDGKAPKRCVTEQNFGLYGEDMFIDICMGKVLGMSSRPTDERLMCEANCHCPSWYWCSNGTDRVSFHPFKSIEAWGNCYANSMALDTHATKVDGKNFKRIEASAASEPLVDEEAEASSAAGEASTTRNFWLYGALGLGVLGTIGVAAYLFRGGSGASGAYTATPSQTGPSPG